MQGDSKLRAARVLFFLGLLALPANAAEQNTQPNPSDWPAIERAARGQTVYWNAWGGDDRNNAYVAWVGEEVKRRFGVTLN
ncbi:MAG: ABC transporter substrate-binding protein, partial [Aestuariivirgaceae bacterium]